MKLSAVFPPIFLFISFVFSSPIPSAVDDIGATVQTLFEKCPDSIPLCKSNDPQKVLFTIRLLLVSFEQAAEQSPLAKPLHETGQGLQKLQDALQKKTDGQDVKAAKSLEGLVHALGKLQGFLGEIEKKSPLPNIAPRGGKEGLDKPSGGKLLFV